MTDYAKLLGLPRWEPASIEESVRRTYGGDCPAGCVGVEVRDQGRRFSATTEPIRGGDNESGYALWSFFWTTSTMQETLAAIARLDDCETWHLLTVMPWTGRVTNHTVCDHRPESQDDEPVVILTDEEFQALRECETCGGKLYGIGREPVGAGCADCR